MKFLEKVIVAILIGFISYLYLTPFVHEFGHYLYAVANGWEVTAFQVSVPAFVSPSFVSVVVPINTSVTHFLMAGSWFALIIGFIISLFPIFVGKHYYILPIGYGLMSDSLIYPIFDLVAFQTGDWYILGLIPSIITVGFFFVFLTLSVGFNKIVKGFRFRMK